MNRVLIFGSTGEIGTACTEAFTNAGWETIGALRNYELTHSSGKFDAVVWAQGVNLTSPFNETSDEIWDEILDANLKFIVRTCRSLTMNAALNQNSSLVIVSSIYEKVARRNKAAYTVSKSALSGLVRSLSVEFMDVGIRVNSVLPGVLDTEMTRKHLSAEIIGDIEEDTFTGQLLIPKQIAQVILFLASKSSVAINGQMIVADGGWMNASFFRD